MNSPASAPSVAPTSLAWGRIAAITLIALGAYVGVRLLPTGTNLSHMDFQVSGENSIQFCDPSNPQFLPVVDVRSPVSMRVTPDQAPVQGQEITLTLKLQTSSGKPIAPEDLVVAHTRKLHIMIVDPTLEDYQHVHPEPGETPGTWQVSFQPHRSGLYRIFADFTPAATNLGLYANADLEVAASPEVVPPVEVAAAEDLHFRLTPSAPFRAGQVTDLKLSVTRADGGSIPLEPVMGAFAHVVAFDEARSGFAHLHPMEVDLLQPPDAHHPELNFQVTIPSPGRYVIWSQMNVGGTEVFRPFWFEVAE